MNNGKNGFLFKIEDFMTLSRKIIYYKKNKKKLHSKINNAYKNLTKFNLEKNLDEYWKVVKKFI